MGNITGPGIGAAIGALGGPPGMIIGAAIGGAVQGGAEIANAYPYMEGDGGHDLSPIRYLDDHRIVQIFLARCTLMHPLINTPVTAARAIFAPISTRATRVENMQHHWIIMKLDNGRYITSYKTDKGIFAEVHSSWDACFMTRNCGAKGGKANGEVFMPQWQDCYARNRKVIDFVRKAQSLPSYYTLTQFKYNCQGYADAIRQWC